MRADGRIELVFHDAGLHAGPARSGVDLEDGIHVARQVDHDPSVSDWPLVPVPPPRGANFKFANRCSPSSVAMRTRSISWRGKMIACGAQLVDRVVRRHDRAVGGAGREIPREAARPQLGAEERVQRQSDGSGRQARNHRVTPEPRRKAASRRIAFTRSR